MAWKDVEVVGISNEGLEDAVRAAVAEARRTTSAIASLDVVSIGLRGDDLRLWRVVVRLGSVGEEGDERPLRPSAAAEAAAIKLEEGEL